jgi:hypothetical protein
MRRGPRAIESAHGQDHLRKDSPVLFAIIGGLVSGACLIFIAWAVYDQSVNIPSGRHR